ncbi:MAG: methylaspartate ammonia-lyase [Spirochaetes bacterium]|nr:methylaspartate ammonia-lyase [Spirochaetota bacterium]
MKIKRVLFAPGTSAFFFDDQRAIKAGAEHDGFVYMGKPVTPGFSRIREAGQSISILLILEDGSLAVGDCAAVQYSGAGGRDPLFLAPQYLPILEQKVKPFLEGREVRSFRTLVEELKPFEQGAQRLHTAILYGLTQALLDACAQSQRKLMCEVIAEEYGLPLVLERIPIFAQTGDERYNNVDKMILKKVDVLPHGLINNIPDKLGYQGEKLREYIRWIVNRIETLRPGEKYCPTLHFDVYGTLGLAFDGKLDRVASYIASLERDAAGLPLYIEGPVDMEEKGRQIEALQRIKERLAVLGSRVKIVADEWCNTYEDIREFTDAQCCHMVQIKTPDLGGIENIVESVLYCKSHGMEAYQGGTCNETDVSARVCVHIALATQPHRMLAKPGMGFDEGFTIVRNEMERALAVLRYRKEDRE